MMQKPTQILKYDPERILKRFFKSNCSLLGLRRKNEYSKDYDMSGGKRPSRPQKWSKLLQIVQTILARIQEVCLPDSYI